MNKATKVGAEYTKFMIQEAENRIATQTKEEEDAQVAFQNSFSDLEKSFQLTMEKDAKLKEYAKFLENVKIKMLGECIYKIMNDAQGVHFVHEGDESIKRALIDSFIRENGVGTLLSQFKIKTNFLHEMANTVERHYQKVVEATDPEEKTDFAIDTSITDDFFRDLNVLDAGEATETIRMRVTAAIDEFIADNIRNKSDIEDALKDAKDKAFLTDNETVKESYEAMAKQKINRIRSKSKSVFGAMVENMTAAIVKTEALQGEYMNEGKVDLDKVVDRTRILYTFVETLNTLKMDKVDESYLKSFIESIN